MLFDERQSSKQSTSTNEPRLLPDTDCFRQGGVEDVQRLRALMAPG